MNNCTSLFIAGIFLRLFFCLFFSSFSHVNKISANRVKCIIIMSLGEHHVNINDDCNTRREIEIVRSPRYT